ncbi:MAG TPA: acyl carrier protein [Candidatus Binatia bacterium]|jgi:D-alanine--poly(phosphoribitol) ligase subunit 2
MSDANGWNDQITALFLQQMDIAVPSIHTDLFDAGILDSLAFVDLLARLEEQFGIRVSIDDLELENFRSVAKIASFAASKSKNGFKVAI